MVTDTHLGRLVDEKGFEPSAISVQRPDQPT